MALRLKIWWYFSEPKPFKSKPNQRPVAADFQFSSCVIRYTLWGSCPSAARALTGASLLLLVWACSCHWDVYPWVFSTVLGFRAPLGLSPCLWLLEGFVAPSHPHYQVFHHKHTHTTQQDCWLVHVFFSLFRCFSLDVFSYRSSCYYIFTYFTPFSLLFFFNSDIAISQVHSCE